MLYHTIGYSFQIPDKPIGRVNDFANIFSKNFIYSMEEKLASYDEKTGNEIVIVTIPSLEGEDLESFSIKLAEKWKIGKKGRDNGVIILVALEDRKIRIEVGYGLEEKLTDAVASIIIRNYMASNFREGNFEKGVSIAVEKIMEVISEGEETFLKKEDNSNVKSFLYTLLILLAFLIFIDLIRYFMYLFSYKKGRYSFFEWVLIFSFTFFIFKMIFLSSNGRRGYTGGSVGFWGGGASGGGFSGGGGSFGGGGASGGW